MKKTRQCPKCRSPKIIVIPGWTGSHGRGQYLRMTGFHILSASIKYDKYVCGSCGFIEAWISDESSLEKLNKKMRNASDL
jgi:predicted nucleic-acid-binding Zn-ribbon protein